MINEIDGQADACVLPQNARFLYVYQLSPWPWIYTSVHSLTVRFLPKKTHIWIKLTNRKSYALIKTHLCESTHRVISIFRINYMYKCDMESITRLLIYIFKMYFHLHINSRDAIVIDNLKWFSFCFISLLRTPKCEMYILIS